MFKLVLAAGLGALTLTAPGLRAQDQPAKLNDANIVAIFDAANKADVETGGLAAEKATNKEVKEMGKMFADAHTSLRHQADSLAKKLGVKPVLPTGDQGGAQHDAAMKALSSKSGADFDKAWLAHEIAYHQAVIDAVTKTLLPAIHNPELKAFVEKCAPAFQGHLAAAQNLQKKLGYTT